VDGDKGRQHRFHPLGNDPVSNHVLSVSFGMTMTMTMTLPPILFMTMPTRSEIFDHVLRRHFNEKLVRWFFQDAARRLCILMIG
jgi:hypothetical protein